MLSGDAVEPGDASEVPGKSFLFFLTNWQGMEWDYPEIFRVVWQSRWLSHLSGAISMVHEKPGDYLHQNRSCTHNRIRSPRWIASGRCDNVGKGSRQIRSVTSGKGLALRTGCMRLPVKSFGRWSLANSSRGRPNGNDCPRKLEDASAISARLTVNWELARTRGIRLFN